MFANKKCCCQFETHNSREGLEEISGLLENKFFRMDVGFIESDECFCSCVFAALGVELSI